MIKVFHGSYIKVEHPEISFSWDTLDFGRGFYVTPFYDQAVSWALRWKHRHRGAVVSRYVFHDELIAGLEIKIRDFPAYDREWLHFVAANRDGRAVEKFDIVQGGIANDKVFNTLELFFAKLIPEAEALARLKYEKPNRQICFCRQDLIDRLLSFEAAEEVEDGSR